MKSLVILFSFFFAANAAAAPNTPDLSLSHLLGKPGSYPPGNNAAGSYLPGKNPSPHFNVAPIRRSLRTRRQTPNATNGTASSSTCSYWLENIKHQGVAAFNNDTSYQVFRNVKDFGAMGDGVTDDTAAINAAISSGGRCGPGTCASTTVTPALVYFPAGSYLVSAPIIDYYYTQLIGNPNCLPTIKASANFTGAWVIDGDQYGANGLGFGATNVFWRQVRNFVIDITAVPATTSLRCIHWPTAQATSLQNIAFQMSSAAGTEHEGVFIESGSGGFVTDLVFYGGMNGATWG